MTLWVGVMSGTSLDGIDVAVVDFAGDDERPASWELVAFRTQPYDAAARARLREAIWEGSAETLCGLDFDLGRAIAEAVLVTMEAAGIAPSDVAGIGSHGQTVWHRPPAPDSPGATLQLGQPAVIAERTGIPVASDFRTRDMAAGGEGAPLTAYSDALLFGTDRAIAIQNIGGIANVTALPPASGPGDPIAFDSGPGVTLLDAAVDRLTGGSRAYDEGGRLAAAGAVLEPALAEWLDDPYFDRPPPKTTGRERFSEVRLGRWLEAHAPKAEDGAATLTELTARTVVDAYRWIDLPVATVYLCGGGARNPVLANRIRELLDPVPVADLSELGVDPDAREAVAFALLARQHKLRFPANAPWATGAAGPRVLGSWTPG